MSVVQLRLPPKAMAVFKCHEVDTLDKDSPPEKHRLAAALQSASPYGAFDMAVTDLPYVLSAAKNTLDILHDRNDDEDAYAIRGIKDLIVVATRILNARIGEIQ